MPLLEDKLQAEGADYSKGVSFGWPFSNSNQSALGALFLCAKGANQSKGHTVSEIDLNSKEVKDAIAAAVAEQVTEQTEGLKAKNAELIIKLKKAKEGSTIDPSDLEAVEKERDEWKGKAQLAEKAAKKATTDLEAANKRAETAEGFTSKLLVDNGLTDALVKAGVTNPVHQKAAKAMLAGQVELTDENGTKVPMLSGKKLADSITEWAGTDEGKFFVTAPDANGGGAHNNGRQGDPPKGDMGGDKAARTARAAELLKQNS
ncbi:hypothetical protein [Pseudoxanthomonas sacheonensis]|uniref:hypothetical protein n=1 Tax=Pseudoxanthomonas sacheonensis TaxID=443615 RepID=UPI0013D8DAB3|nr:hypothetical protein [Pseudoxanthomonas sacheonensis]KAF1706281.1 hypothetical protein CSC73_16385 [Pseudoxanthomonas sacheonensis]